MVAATAMRGLLCMLSVIGCEVSASTGGGDYAVPLLANHATPACTATLDRLCASFKTPLAKCDGCLLTNSAKLTASGCNSFDETQFCKGTPPPPPSPPAPAPPGPSPGPIAPKCEAALVAGCAASRNSSVSCLMCCGAHEKALEVSTAQHSAHTHARVCVCG